MYKYFVEEPEMIELKDQIDYYSGIEQGRLKRLLDILGGVSISREFIDAYLSYFDYTCSKRGNLSLTEESLKGMYDLSQTYPQLGSEGLKLIMGEYVKDMFDEAQPLKFFDGMILKEKDDSFKKFMHLLRHEGEKSDMPYKEEARRVETYLLPEYGEEFVKYIKDYAVQYHKTFEDIYYSIPYASVIRKDADTFYEIGRRELFGAIGYPHSFTMCKFMILYGSVDSFRGQLMYDSTIKGTFESPMTVDEFLESIEEKRKERKEIKIRKK